MYLLIGALILSTVGFFAHTPTITHAATCPDLSPGDLFKVEGVSSIYLINAEGRRMYFPTSDVFHTYFHSFGTATITEITPACVDAYPNAVSPAGLPYRAGSRLVKVAVSNKLYGVGFNGTRHWIPDADTAEGLYGSNWGSLIRDIHDFHWSNYVEGASVTPGVPHDGMLIDRLGGAAVYAVSNGYTKEIVGTLPPFIQSDVRRVSKDVLFSLPNSTISVAADTVATPFLLPNYGQPHIDGQFLSATIRQDGRSVALEGDQIVRLQKKPFDLVIGAHEDSGVMVHADIVPTTLEATRNGTPMDQLFSPGGGMAEFHLNPNRELLIKDNAYHYWFFQDELSHRYNRVFLDGSNILGTRTVEQFRFSFIDFDDIVVPVEDAGGPIYLSFFIAETNPDTYEWIEFQRGYLTIEWIE